jgi:hypothetical protein
MHYEVSSDHDKVTDIGFGYPNVATFLDSDRAFMMYRRFGYISSRLLLDKQDELRGMEREMDLMDLEDAETDELRLRTCDQYPEDVAHKKELFSRMEAKFREYGKMPLASTTRLEGFWLRIASLLVTAQQLASFQEPTSWDYKSVWNYMHSTEAPLCETDTEWVEWKGDLVSLRPGRDHAWLDSIIEHILKWCQCKLGAKSTIEYFFCSQEDIQKSQGETVYFNRQRIERVALSIIISAILALLIIPIYILYHLVTEIGTAQSYSTCIGILLVFTLLFSAVISAFTKAKRHEILAAAAAYVFRPHLSPDSWLV